MPRFRFTIRAPDRIIEDRDGSEFSDFDAALAEARESARELWADGIRAGQDRRDWSILILDEWDQIRDIVVFRETAERN